MAGIVQGIDDEEGGVSGGRRISGINQGLARNFHHANDDPSFSESRDIDITYLSTDYIDLRDVLAEQLQLQVPFQPLCEESCKGICPQCGTELNFTGCSCKKLETQHPFAVLRDYKL
jgi:uncharacterized metal-binding protein YceD (DUF177 family)